MNCPKCGKEMAFNANDNLPTRGYWECINPSCEKNVSRAKTSKKSYKELATEIGTLVDEKNAAYGNSFNKCGDFLKLLYPEGIKPEQYTDALCIVRMFDKLMRVATKKDAFGESPFRDLVGYSLLGVMKDEA